MTIHQLNLPQKLLKVSPHFLLFVNTAKKPEETPHEKCPYSVFSWSVFSRIWSEYGEIQSISLYLVDMPENTDQKNTKYGHFSRGVFSGNEPVSLWVPLWDTIKSPGSLPPLQNSESLYFTVCFSGRNAGKKAAVLKNGWWR